jgi:acyl dehydratase
MTRGVIQSAAELKALAGQEVGLSDWVEVDQKRVNLFAEATGDHQWIHTDPERAAKESPFGGVIAHGYLTLSLTPALIDQVMPVDKLKMGVNYGLNKVRFPAPLAVGKRVRLRVFMKNTREIRGAIQTVMELTVEVEGQQKPACVAETLGLYYFND